MSITEINDGISVIIPVFNDENTISECLESVLSQNIDKMEIICIDDGSTDGTWRILKKYEKRFTGMKVYQQENMGPGKTRNNGIMKARGKYVTFMDGDDLYPDYDVLKNLYESAERESVMVCGGTQITFTGKWNSGINYPPNGDLFFIENKKMRFNIYGNPYGFHRFIFNRKMLLKHNLFFPDYRYGEDPVFLAKVLTVADYFYGTSSATYAIRRGEHISGNKERDIRDFLAVSCDLTDISYESANIKLQQRVLTNLCDESMYGKICQLFDIDSLYVNEKLDHIIQRLIPGEENLGFIRCFSADMMRQSLEKSKDHMEELLKLCKSNKKIVIYGAGKIGHLLHDYLSDNEIDICGFSVTRKETAIYGNGLKKPIKEIKEWKEDKSILFLIAVKDESSKAEINHMLNTYSLNHRYFVNIADLSAVMILD